MREFIEGVRWLAVVWVLTWISLVGFLVWYPELPIVLALTGFGISSSILLARE